MIGGPDQNKKLAASLTSWFCILGSGMCQNLDSPRHLASMKPARIIGTFESDRVICVSSNKFLKLNTKIKNN